MEAKPRTSETHVECVREAKLGDAEFSKFTTTGTSSEEIDARTANRREHEETLWESLRSQPYAVWWSALVSVSIIMEGYDTILISNFFGYPAFQRQFGTDYGDIGYQIPGPWQVGLASGQVAGSIIGATMNGLFINRYGYKKTFFVALVAMNAAIFLPFFGKSLTVQVVGQVICGIPWGVFATIGSSYASEICPMKFRGYLTAFTNMCFAIGQFIGSGILQSMVDRTDQWSYRIPFALQWMWPTPLLLVAIFMPESPWWLVRSNRIGDAEKSMERLISKKHGNINPKQVVAMMVHTNELEKNIQSGTSYIDCFRGNDLRRTIIACLVFAGQNLSGSSFAYSATYFLQQAGLNADNAYKVGLGGTAIAFIGTLLSWVLMTHFGRRTIYITGMGSICICLLLIGILASATPDNTAATWGQGGLALLWLLSFSLSVGPVGWTIPAEVSSTRLRPKTVVLGRNAYYITNLCANIIQPYMMNPAEWNWKGKTGFFWLGTASLTLVWAYFCLPETGGRTFEELDLLFAAKVSSRKFKSRNVDAYDEGVETSAKKQDAHIV